MRLASLVWTNDQLRILTENTEFTARLIIAPDERYALQLSADDTGRLYLRIPQGYPPFWMSQDGGSTFIPIPSVPRAGGPLSAYQCKVHKRSGLITAIEGRNLWVYTIGTERWQPRMLPENIHVRDVSFDLNGGLWCAGSVDSRRIPGLETEAAVRYQAQPEMSFQSRSPRLGPIDATRAVAYGGLEELRTVDAEGEPAIATSVCAWFLDDSSSFIFTFASKRTYFKRLKDEMIRFINRPQPGLVQVFTNQGGVWEGNGLKLKRGSILSSLRKALDMPDERSILIRGLDCQENKIAVVVEVSPAGRDSAQDPEFTAVCLSVDGGSMFDVVRRIAFADGAEIQDVAWLAN